MVEVVITGTVYSSIPTVEVAITGTVYSSVPMVAVVISGTLYKCSHSGGALIIYWHCIQ